jgi:hypothetical protein
MRYFKQKISTLAAVMTVLSAVVAATSASAAKIAATVSVDKHEVFIGEAAVLSVKVSNFKDGMEPDLTQLKDCDITFLSSRDESFVSIINGHRSPESFSGRIFYYNITPKRTGRIKLSPIIIRRGKHKRTFTGPTIMVHGVEKQNYVTLSIKPSSTSVIVDEAFTVDVILRIKKLPAPYTDVSPLPPRDPPHLEIPFLQDDFFKGLKCPEIKPLIQNMLVSNPGTPALTINNFTVSSFMSNEPARFDLTPSETTINGISYMEYSLTLKYVPQTEGSYTFGPASFKGRIFINAQGGRGITKNIYTIAPAQTVRVVPPPQENRPDSYIGAIATNISVKASMDTQTCKVGDPLTLTLEISGNFQLDNLTQPKLSTHADITENFRVYDSDNGRTKDNTRIYKYTVRPTKAGTYEFPPIKLSFYNPGLKQYQTISTKPIPIRARPASEFSENTVIDTAEQSVTIIDTANTPAAKTPAPVEIAPLAAVTPIFVPRIHLPLLLSGPVILLLLLIFRLAERHIPTLAARRKIRQAAAKAMHQLKSAAKSTEPYREIAAAMRQYAATHLNLNAASATAPEINAALSRHGIPAETADNFTALLEQNFNRSFNSAETPDKKTLKNDITAARNAIKKLEAAF